jgi:hypothetical protein
LRPLIISELATGGSLSNLDSITAPRLISKFVKSNAKSLVAAVAETEELHYVKSLVVHSLARHLITE